MKRFILFVMVILGIAFTVSAQREVDSFKCEEISDEVYARIKGKSFKDDCTTLREDLRYLRVLHFNKEGELKEGELVCHKSIANDLSITSYSSSSSLLTTINEYPCLRLITSTL